MSDATLSVIIFVLVMVVIISEKVHRAVCAVGGAVLLIILGVLDIGTGVSYIDYNTIGLLIGMMMFVAVVKHSGMFEYLAVKSAKVAKGDPWKMMIFFIIITAVLSGSSGRTDDIRDHEGNGSESCSLYHDADTGV